MWFRPSLGHLLRQTVPLHQYLGRIALVGLFRRDPQDLSFLALPWLRLKFFGKAFRERAITPSSVFEPGHGDSLVLIDGRVDHFGDLNIHQARLKQDFYRIVASRHLDRVSAMPSFPIGINLRLGKDFLPPPLSHSLSEGYQWVGWLQQTPLAWFIETLQLIRKHSGWCVPAVVVSDGTAHQLSQLLQLPETYHLSPSNAVIDLLVLSKTQLLLGSGSSTFSAWAAFLGQQPAFTAPGHPFTNLKLEPLAGQMIASFDPRQPDLGCLRLMCEAVERIS